MSKPSPEKYPAYVQEYINQVPEDNLDPAFKNQAAIIEQFLTGITEEKSMYSYAPGKWTIKEMLLHITDAERIFSYRALCFARKEKTSLPGFEEDEYAANSNANERSWKSIVEEFFAVRKATELLFNSFSEATMQIVGNANNKPTSVASIGFIALGHFYHHKKILEERYF